MSRKVTVVEPGLETTVQELPGRRGFLEQGFPVSGPFDAWSFRQANLLVGNEGQTAALECQVIGPALRFDAPVRVAVTGADMAPTLDGEAVEMWTTLEVAAGQVLRLGPALTGVRAYVAVDGGLATTPVLGSRAVFHQARVGGAALVEGGELPLGAATSGDRLRVPKDRRPDVAAGATAVEAMCGPNDDWLTEDAVAAFFAAEWTLQPQSSRTGLRLTGPELAFSARATDKNTDHGQDPSNIIDHGYPLGAVNLAGRTPIVLVHDAPSTGGFINPFTVVSAALWKLAQARAGEPVTFRRVDRDAAAGLRAAMADATRPEVLARA